MFLAGTKRWEFRTRRPDVRRGEHHLVYESRGAGMIVAEMRIGRVITGTPDEVWEAVGHAGGVTREFFDRYFSWPDGHPRAGQMRGEACAIEMFPRELARPVPLPSTMRAPQSWARWKGQWPLPN
jgi:predicted transcriptional regulator